MAGAIEMVVEGAAPAMLPLGDTKMTPEAAVANFLVAIENGGESELDRLEHLLASLDQLSASTTDAAYVFDDREHPDPPQADYNATRQRLHETFPSLGYYPCVSELDGEPSTAEVVMGDALDDLTDIYGDLAEFRWRLEKNGQDDARWYFLFSYKSHWGEHLRWLALYIHRRLTK